RSRSAASRSRPRVSVAATRPGAAAAGTPQAPSIGAAAGEAGAVAGATAASRAAGARRAAVARAETGRAMAKRPRWTRRLLGESDFDAIGDAIKAAETRTAAESRGQPVRRRPRCRLGHPVDPL